MFFLRHTHLLIILLLFCKASVFAESIETKNRDGLSFALYSATHLNPIIKSQKDRIKSLAYSLESAKAQRYPSFIIQGETVDDEDKEVVASLQQPLWVGGRITGAIKKAKAEFKTGGILLLGEQRDLMEETAAVYANIMGLRKQLESAQNNVREHTKLFELIERREAGLIASKADMLLSKSRYAQALSTEEKVKRSLRKALSDLKSLTQQDISAEKQIGDNLFILPDPGEIINLALDASAGVQLKLQQVKVVDADVSLSKADMMPKFYAKIDQDLYLEKKSGSESLDTRYGVVLLGSLDGSGVFGWKRIKSSQKRVKAAQKDVDAAKNDVRRKVRSLIEERLSLLNLVKVNILLVDATRETLASFLRQYNIGRKTWIDVLNAQREFASSRLTQEETKSALLQTELRIAVLTGMLDKMAGVNNEFD